MELLSTDQISIGDGNLDMIGERYSSENSMQQFEDRKFSISSGSQLSSSQNLLTQKLHSDSTSPSNITSECYPHRSCQFSPSGSFGQRNSMVQQLGQPIHDKEQLGQQTLSRRASYPRENYEVGKKGLGKRSMGDRQEALGTSTVVDGSFMSSLSSDNSVEESSFRQLQDAVSQVHGYFLSSSSCVWFRKSNYLTSSHGPLFKPLAILRWDS
jgi:hypothetical protein